mmetsp:Transcript_31703/g.53490  ORF Transcript_31703/g.53490 Transcript_31703/m.53490 type:complete len:135 (+) Transcript_31703:223-627(+)
MGPANRAVTMKLLRYSVMMILGPILTFYFTYYVIFQQNKEMLAWCGILAVIVANAVVVAYVIMAYSEEDEERSNKERIDIGGGRNKTSYPVTTKTRRADQAHGHQPEQQRGYYSNYNGGVGSSGGNRKPVQKVN